MDNSMGTTDGFHSNSLIGNSPAISYQQGWTDINKTGVPCHALSFAPATLVCEAKIETGARIKTGARPCVEFWSCHSCEWDKAVRTYMYSYYMYYQFCEIDLLFKKNWTDILASRQIFENIPVGIPTR